MKFRINFPTKDLITIKTYYPRLKIKLLRYRFLKMHNENFETITLNSIKMSINLILINQLLYLPPEKFV